MTEITETKDFIRNIIKEEMENGRFSQVHTRFPPEPNGYLHIGHVTAIYADFSIAEEFGGQCNLRFDDTNPIKEKTEYVDGIMDDIKWLGFDWEDRLYFTSDYFDQLYTWAIQLINQGDAYVDDLDMDEIRDYRGTLTEPGKNSPYRDRSITENLELFERMKAGEFPNGSHVLRAKIDMASPIINMRDPVMYRILHADHHRTGDKWKIYPMYDWAHGQSDSIEGVTYSLCSLEYLNHRPLYDWFLDKLGIDHPQQLEFGRVSINHTITSKRKLRRLVEGGHVDGWDDPRLPTVIAMRRRGYTAAALRDFCKTTGLSKSHRHMDVGMLEHAVRNDLNTVSPRAMAVMDPLRVVVKNYPEGQVEWFELPDYPQDKKNRPATRKVPFSRLLYVERDDFMEEPPRKFFRLGIGREVRFLGAYYITCTDIVKDEDGKIVELHCTYDPESQGGRTPDKRKVRGTIHWVSAHHAITATARLYDRLFLSENPEAEDDFITDLNPDSLRVIENIQLEPSLANASSDTVYQFMRKGYFVPDEKESTPDALIFNRTISMRDTWAKRGK